MTDLIAQLILLLSSLTILLLHFTYLSTCWIWFMIFFWFIKPTLLLPFPWSIKSDPRLLIGVPWLIVQYWVRYCLEVWRIGVTSVRDTWHNVMTAPVTQSLTPDTIPQYRGGGAVHTHYEGTVWLKSWSPTWHHFGANLLEMLWFNAVSTLKFKSLLKWLFLVFFTR